MPTVVAKKNRTTKRSQAKPTYHVTSVQNVESILRIGLKGGSNPRHRGDTPLKTPSIFVLTVAHENVTDYLAIGQLWPYEDIQEYAVIEIDPAGVTGQVKADHVAERSASFHRIIKQELIEPKHLKLVNRRRLGFPGRRILDIQQSMAGRKWSAEEWQIARKWMDGPILHLQEQYEKGKLKRN